MLRLITAATEAPVSLADLKAHVEASDFSDDDVKLQVFLDAATAYVAKRCELVLAPATYRVERSCWWDSVLSLLTAPVREIVSVKYLDVDGDEQTLSSSAYRWIRTASGADIRLLDMSTLPDLADDRSDAVRIEVDAGFDIDGVSDDPELVLPRQIVPAIRMLAAHWYANREAAGKDAMSEIPYGVEALTRQIMVYR